MPIVFTNPTIPEPVTWESVTQNNAMPFAPSLAYANMWLLPDDTILVKNGATTKDIAIFDPATGLWTSKNDLPESASTSFAVFHPITGNPVTMPAQQPATKYMEYDIDLDSWTVTSINFARSHWGGGTCNIPNGDTMSFSNIGTSAKYDQATLWDGALFTAVADIPTVPLNNAGYSMPFASSNGNVYLMGSRNEVGSSSSDIVYKYNISSDMWSVGPSLPVALVQIIIVPLDGTRAMLIGGSTSGAGGASQFVYIFDSTAETYTAFAGVRTTENPTALPTAMNSAAAVLQADGKVLFMGDSSTLWRTTAAP